MGGVEAGQSISQRESTTKTEQVQISRGNHRYAGPYDDWDRNLHEDGCFEDPAQILLCVHDMLLSVV